MAALKEVREFLPLVLDGTPKYLGVMQCSEAAFLSHCHTNFEYDAAKIVPAGHLGHIEFWPVAGL